MTRLLDTLSAVAPDYDAVVLDQWGVLHDGSTPYPRAIAALEGMLRGGVRLAVLSNSGKRAAPNADRIAAMGFAPELFETVMTSGEALWQDIAAGRQSASRLLPIERAAGDAAAWAKGLDVVLVDDVSNADAILLMGLPDKAAPDAFAPRLAAALERDLPVYCTNPDRASPRAGGVTVVSPGALAHDYAARGGRVLFYGKPHLPVFRAVEAALGVAPARLLMVGDSLEHDIAGAEAAGWASAFVRGGLHAAAFRSGDTSAALTRLVRAEAAPAPTYSLQELC
ncbi:MAG: TIGR01459 family HAD-type hydrolase [Pseudomonadota bacterium]